MISIPQPLSRVVPHFAKLPARGSRLRKDGRTEKGDRTFNLEGAIAWEHVNFVGWVEKRNPAP